MAVNSTGENPRSMNDQEINPEQLIETMQLQVPREQGKLEMDTVSSFAWSLSDLLNSVDGEWIGPMDSDNQVRFTSVSTDTRSLQPGALYIAVKGENFDGHAFIKQAVQQGAVAVLVSESIETIVPGVLVEDTRIALGQFAKWHRQQMPVKKLIAVTGSNGKTTTKTLLLNIFQQVGSTLATQGNLNNDFGVPRTLLDLRPEHEFAIIEMGANHRKEIGYLTDLAQPDIAMITNASGAHLEGFGSLQGVIETKGEIFQGLNQSNGQEDGVAVINTDSNGYQDWLQIIQSLGIKNSMKFGSQKDADIAMTHFTTTEAGIRFELSIAGQQQTVEMPVLGQHNAMNAAACTAIALSAGIDWKIILSALNQFTGVAGRLNKQVIKTGWLIDDSYNANPESVKAGIDALVSLKGEAILCLGTMAELGEQSVEMHQEIADYAKQQGVGYLFTYGQATEQMPSTFGELGEYFESHETLSKTVIELLQQKTEQKLKVNVLVKGSRSAQMELISQAILNTDSNTNLNSGNCAEKSV